MWRNSVKIKNRQSKQFLLNHCHFFCQARSKKRGFRVKAPFLKYIGKINYKPLPPSGNLQKLRLALDFLYLQSFHYEIQ